MIVAALLIALFTASYSTAMHPATRNRSTLPSPRMSAPTCITTLQLT